MANGSRFEFATAGRIVFGRGSLKEAPGIAAGWGKRALVVTGGGAVDAAGLLEPLAEAGISTRVLRVHGEPSLEVVTAGRDAALESGCEMVIGMGGGSVLDAAKAISALITNPGDPFEYLEVVGRGRSIPNPAAPLLAIPTTAGTGTEVTRNAVITITDLKVKVSMRSALMLPRAALVDPELTYSLPPAVTAATGMDALAQLIEPYVSLRANPLVDGLCLEGMRRAAGALRRAYADGRDSAAREDMSLASLSGGLALANGGLGAVHGFAAPLGGMFRAPHGALCARLLAPVVRANARALRGRLPDSPVVERYRRVAQILTGNPGAAVEDGAAWLDELCAEMQIPRLAAYGVRREDFEVLVKNGAAASSMKANPIVLTGEELAEILEAAY